MNKTKEQKEYFEAIQKFQMKLVEPTKHKTHNEDKVSKLNSEQNDNNTTPDEIIYNNFAHKIQEYRLKHLELQACLADAKQKRIQYYLESITVLNDMGCNTMSEEKLRAHYEKGAKHLLLQTTLEEDIQDHEALGQLLLKDMANILIPDDLYI